MYVYTYVSVCFILNKVYKAGEFYQMNWNMFLFYLKQRATVQISLNKSGECKK